MRLIDDLVCEISVIPNVDVFDFKVGIVFELMIWEYFYYFNCYRMKMLYLKMGIHLAIGSFNSLS